MSFDNSSQIEIYFHNRDQMIVPSINSVFGSSRVYYYTSGFIFPNRTLVYRSTVHLDKVEEMSLDRHEGRRCNASAQSKANNLAACVAKHIERKVGCT